MSKPDGGISKTTLPLNSIRVFVEAARQFSFSRAARALGMTQGGVSHHITSLEKFLGHRLFVRSGSVLDLTDSGRLYFDTVQDAFSTIELSTRQLAQRSADSGRLVVRTSLPTFAMMVLIPALPLYCPVPAVSVDIVTSLSPPVSGDVYDVLITRDLRALFSGAFRRDRRDGLSGDSAIARSGTVAAGPSGRGRNARRSR